MKKNIPEKRGIWRSVADFWPGNALAAHISFLASFCPENGRKSGFETKRRYEGIQGENLAPIESDARARALDNRGVPSGGC